MMADTAKTTRLKHSELEQDASSRWSLKHGGLCLACFHTWDEKHKKGNCDFLSHYFDFCSWQLWVISHNSETKELRDIKSQFCEEKSKLTNLQLWEKIELRDRKSQLHFLFHGRSKKKTIARYKPKIGILKNFVLPNKKGNCDILSHNSDFVSCNYEIISHNLEKKKSKLWDINSELWDKKFKIQIKAY